MDYLIHLFILVGIYLILAQSFNLSFGLSRLLNVAHIAAYGIGAYTTALLATEHQFSLWQCLPLGMILSGVLALAVGLISLRLASDYFIIGTLAFSSLFTALLINWKSLTRGVLGIPGIPRPEVFTVDFSDNRKFLVLLSTIVLVALVTLYAAFRSSFARGLRAQAESEHVALALGKNAFGLRMMSFVVSSMFAGLAGGLYSYYFNYIEPSTFGLSELVFILIIVVVGKPGSYWGVVLSTFFVVLLPEPLRFLSLPSDILGPMRQLLYAVILFAVVYWQRETLFPQERAI